MLSILGIAYIVFFCHWLVVPRSALQVKLERLCRTLQTERAGMAAKLAAAQGKAAPTPPAASSPNGVEDDVEAS